MECSKRLWPHIRSSWKNFIQLLYIEEIIDEHQ